MSALRPDGYDIVTELPPRRTDWLARLDWDRITTALFFAILAAPVVAIILTECAR